jgi:hypothetical protein
MPFDRFLISPFSTGLQTDERPWKIMDDAFFQLQNAYVFRGRVRKRFGSTLMGTMPQLSRLRINIGTNTNAAMNLPANTTTHTPQLAIGQMFTLGPIIFTVYQLGAGVATYTTNAAVTAVVDSTTSPNTITITGGALVNLYWYPSLPVMGITQYLKGDINDHPTYAFDTEFAYIYSNPGWERSGTGAAPIWHGSNDDYFWATNWQGSTTSSNTGQPVLFVTNFHVTNYNGAGAATDDPIWYTQDGNTWNSITTSASNGFYFLPASGSAFPNGPFIVTVRIIVPFKNRLVLLNTVENNNSGGFGAGTNTNYVNRARYSFNGSPFAPNAWYEPNTRDSSGNIAAGAGFIDASTEEKIISAQFIKDRLIVYFERSTWELAYTGNEILPFVWQKLNNELGSQSTFSTVPFDKEILTVGNTGVHSCNGSNVARVDNKIPQFIFDDVSAEADNVVRIAGIRDYDFEMVYWAFVSTEAAAPSEPTQVFPNQILVYNYKTGSWAINDDCFTSFGYLEQQSDITWQSSAPTTWEQFNGTWIEGVTQANNRQILGGTPEGFVLIINPDRSRNAASMQITDMSLSVNILTLTIINHNFAESAQEYPDSGIYVLFENVSSSISSVQTYLNGNIFQINSVPDVNTITIVVYPIPFTGGLTGYEGGGTLARVSNVQCYTKQWNPYDKQDQNVYIQRIDFIVQKTGDFNPVEEGGQITVDYYPSATELSMIEEGTASNAIMGNNILETTPYDPAIYPLESEQERLVHPIYFQSDGTCIQLAMYMSQQQMTNPSISLADFELEGMILWTQPTTSRMQ